jgi:Holliday junction resolvasome RuvABC endonuclease subunit
MIRVVGFDLSLTAPAAIMLPGNWKPGAWGSVRAWLLKPAKPKTEDLERQLQRYIAIRKWVFAILDEFRGDEVHVFVEDYGFSKNQMGASRVRESGGIIRLAVYEKYKIVMQPVPSNVARKLFLGKVPQKDPKVAVQDVLFNKAGAPKKWDENQADALVIANWGLAELGGKFLALPPS